jgi:hypothetical protein
MSLSTFETPADASNKPTTTTTAGNSVKGLYAGAKLDTVKIVSPVPGKNIESFSISSDSDSDNNGQDLVVFYSPELSQEIVHVAEPNVKGISAGFLFSDGGKKYGVVEGIVLFDTKSQIVTAFSVAKPVKDGWQPVYNPAAIQGQAPLDFKAIDRAINVHDHRGIEILIKNTPGQTETA